MTVFLYALVVLIWGTTWIALKWQLGIVPIPMSIAYRFGLATLILFAWLAWRGQLQRPRGRASLWVLGQGLCLFCFNFVCFLNASQTLHSGLVAVVFSSATLWNALLGRLIHGRRLAPQVLGGGGIGLTGLLLLFWPEIAAHGASQATLIGLAWALGGTLCFSIGNMLSAALQGQGLKPAQTNAWGMLVGTCVLLTYCLLAGVPWSFEPTWRYTGALLYLAIPGSVIGFTAYLTLVGRMGPERAAYSTVLFPVVALNVSTWAEGYQWTALGLTGLLLVMAGNVLVFRKPKLGQSKAAARAVKAASPSPMH